MDISARLTEAGFDTDALLEDSLDFLLYYNDPVLTGFSDEEANAAVSLRDYNALMAMQGKGPWPRPRSPAESGARSHGLRRLHRAGRGLR